MHINFKEKNLPSVSIVIPAFNEENRLPKTLELIRDYLVKSGTDAEIIVVDDGSSDATVSIAEKYGVSVIKNPGNRGKGYSVAHGFLKSSGEIIFFSDADLSTPIEFMAPFIKLHNDGFDIVVASRAVPGAFKKIKQPFYRDFMGRTFNLFVKTMTGLKINDTQCGFKSFRRSCALEIVKRRTIDGFGFDVEFLYIAKLLKYKICESPVEWFDAPGTKVNPLRDSAKMFFNLIEIVFKRLSGRYK
ncbi:MAG: glycosyl transferase [Candidatus Goldiibacteriota bacterium HGW-Goldbacteria-1]|nr:MAG: glycosyl transferase [Candidatus Goldiibacteriota bacterium HGW-Goldbacteria-1]